jgi:CRISPR/Cas system Type II protein with McrA/HNH and RuvC-like nuclease domain
MARPVGRKTGEGTRGSAGSGSKWAAPATRLGLYARGNWMCAYCGKTLLDAKWNEMSLDHLVPQNFGGTNDHSNLVMVCAHCNSSKGDRFTADEFARTFPDRFDAIMTTIGRQVSQKVDYKLGNRLLAIRRAMQAATPREVLE